MTTLQSRLMVIAGKEKTASASLLLAQALWLSRQRAPSRVAELETQAQRFNEMFEHQRSAEMIESMRHTAVPQIMTGGDHPGMLLGGIEEGFVHLASAIGQSMAQRDVEFEKQALPSWGTLAGAAKGFTAGVPKLVASLGEAAKKAPAAATAGIKNTIGKVQGAAASFDQKVNTAVQTRQLASKYDSARAQNRVSNSLNNAGNAAKGAVGLPAQAAQQVPISDEMRRASASRRSGLPMQTQTSGQRASANRAGQVGAPPVDASQGPYRTPAPTPPEMPAQVQKPPEHTTPPGTVAPPVQAPAQAGQVAPPGNAEPGLIDQGINKAKEWANQSGLMGGQAMPKLLGLGAGLAGMYGLYQGAKGLAHVAGQEAEPANYGVGPQPR